MEAMRSKVMGLVGKKDNVINLFLVGTFAAIGIRSWYQEKLVEALEAEKSSLQSGNRSMSAAMWGWRQNLFDLAESDPSKLPISLSRLRAIYGEDEPPAVANQGYSADEESISIA